MAGGERRQFPKAVLTLAKIRPLLGGRVGMRAALLPCRAKNPLVLDPRHTAPDALRHLVESFFQKLKKFKRIAMRARKTDTSFKAMINLAATVIRTRGQ